VRFRWRRRNTFAALPECLRLWAPSDEGTIIGGPVRDGVLGLVRGIDSRTHPFSVVAVHSGSRESQSLDLSGLRIHAPTPASMTSGSEPNCSLIVHCPVIRTAAICLD
jgi:hypothetical protein